MNFPFRSAALAGVLALSCGAAVRADEVQQATGPVEIDAGDIFVVRSPANVKWLLSPHGGNQHRMYVVVVGQAGDIAINVHDLPTGGGDPDDPDDPPPSSLATLVRGWAAEVGHDEGRQKLAAAYAATTQLVDKGTISTVEQLVALQALANTTVLGSDAAKWKPFFEKLEAHLDQNTPSDLAGYKAVWTQIVEGLQ